MKTNDGGPAFPIPRGNPGGSDLERSFNPGMTLRDWFAGQALVGLCGGPGMPSDLPAYAERAFAIADEMITARRLPTPT